MIKIIINTIRRYSLSILKAVLILAVIGSLFYWYEYRPMKIKQGCMRDSLKSDKVKDRDDLRYFYWKCTIEKGT